MGNIECKDVLRGSCLCATTSENFQKCGRCRAATKYLEGILSAGDYYFVYTTAINEGDDLWGSPGGTAGAWVRSGGVLERVQNGRVGHTSHELTGSERKRFLR